MRLLFGFLFAASLCLAAGRLWADHEGGHEISTQPLIDQALAKATLEDETFLARTSTANRRPVSGDVNELDTIWTPSAK